MQPVYLLVDTPAHILQSVLGVMDVGLVIGDGVYEVHYAKLVVLAMAVCPDVPYEQGPHYLAVLLHEGLQVQDLAVVQRGTGAGTVQSLGMAAVVLYGIDIGMQHIVVVAHLLAQRGLALQEPVVVGIHAGYHVGPQVVHQGRLLSLAQGGSGRQHYLETDIVRLVFVQHITPESYVVITFHVCHNAFLGTVGLEPVGCRNVVGCYVADQSSSHVFKRLAVSGEWCFIHPSPFGTSPVSGAKRGFRRMTRCHSVPSEGRTPSVRHWAG